MGKHSVEEGSESIQPDREERKDRHQASGPCQEVGEGASLGVCAPARWHRVPVDRVSHGIGAGCSYCCQLLSCKGRWGKRLGAAPGKRPHALRSCAVSRLEGGGLTWVPVLFEVHPSTRFRRLSVQSVHLGQAAAKHQVVRKGRHQPTQSLACDGNPAGGQVCIGSGKSVSQRHKRMIGYRSDRRRTGFASASWSSAPSTSATGTASLRPGRRATTRPQRCVGGPGRRPRVAVGPVRYAGYRTE